MDSWGDTLGASPRALRVLAGDFTPCPRLPVRLRVCPLGKHSGPRLTLRALAQVQLSPRPPRQPSSLALCRKRTRGAPSLKFPCWWLRSHDRFPNTTGRWPGGGAHTQGQPPAGLRRANLNFRTWGLGAGGPVGTASSRRDRPGLPRPRSRLAAPVADQEQSSSRQRDPGPGTVPHTDANVCTFPLESHMHTRPEPLRPRRAPFCGPSWKSRRGHLLRPGSATCQEQDRTGLPQVTSGRR